MFNDLHIQTREAAKLFYVVAFQHNQTGKRASTDSIAKWCIKFVYMKNRNEWGIADGDFIENPLLDDIQGLNRKQMPEVLKKFMPSD